nr:LacI family DNA-binding transcriptional regulator [Arsenicicoccus piscis]
MGPVSPSRQSPAPRHRAERRPTLRDVARLAEVSTSTASLVFSGKGPVADATRTRVLAAAESLGYGGPDPVAASLRTGRSGVVAVIFDSSIQETLHDPYQVLVLDGAASVFDELGLGMLIIGRVRDESERALAQLSAAPIDAAMFFSCGQGRRSVVDSLAARQIPLVGLGAPRDPRIVQCDIDSRVAMRLVAEHVAGLGHQRVGEVTLPDLQAPHTAARHAALVDVFGSDLVTAEATLSGVESGEQAARALLADPVHRPTAILAHSDLLAVGVMQAAESLGLRVPEDLSVTGFDGVDLPWWPTPLTTVAQPGSDKGARAARLVRDGLAGEPGRDVVLQAHLVVGATTAPPAV